MERQNSRTKSLVNPVKNITNKNLVNTVNDKFTSIQNNDCSKILNMFVKLSNYIEFIKILFYEYSLKNISMVASILTPKKYLYSLQN